MRSETKILRRAYKLLAPPPDLKISEWAEENMVLSREYAGEPGKYHVDRAPYQREMMDSVCDPKIQKTVFMTSSQIGKNTIINNVIGYYIDVDPGPMIIVEPTLNFAKDYSKRRLAPMIRDVKVLSQKVSDEKSRDSDNTILMKTFPGGFLTLIGANAPRELAGRPIRIILADEIDGYCDSAGKEGDPLMLIEKRAITFWNKKFIYVSTPLIKGASRIEEEYEKGTQEEWRVECPHCGGFFYILFKDIRFKYNKYKRKNRTVYEVLEVKWRCPACMEEYPEHTMKRQPAKWEANNPEAEGIRSFKVNAFSSPWYKWKDIIKEFLESKDDPEKLKVFTNTVLGESWEDIGDIEDEDFLVNRREEYEADLPDGVLLLTCGVDTQIDRFEYEIVGWGRFEESWGIEKGHIWGSPDEESTQERLIDKITQVWRFADGKGLTAAITFVDSGGPFPKKIYKFCKKNESKRVFAIKGRGNAGVPFTDLPKRTKAEKALLFILGVDEGKASIMYSLKIQEVGPRYCHFPKDEKRGYNREYFRGLLSEKMVPRKKDGRIKLAWEKVRTDVGNEPLDCRNYALAAQRFLNVDFDALEKRLKALPPRVQNTAGKQQNKPQKRSGCVKKGMEF
ncbi:phage terminase large subunit GpA-like protein [Anaerobacterium chartisolvens]|uniref:Phage terminase large subunit GpA-like protein n=1 Tax=Anaerobacterium chartisolvens TaxID=1297424 RepID=A0A369BHK8_9FIRM|nr:phage terminase large subunit family protein [Anaerobacterium chartisolvens]RCX20891.1 phage terminase large subunit GpA-like protein [Anaerobacterium chartisolvens]